MILIQINALKWPYFVLKVRKHYKLGLLWFFMPNNLAEPKRGNVLNSLLRERLNQSVDHSVKDIPVNPEQPLKRLEHYTDGLTAFTAFAAIAAFGPPLVVYSWLKDKVAEKLGYK